MPPAGAPRILLDVAARTHRGLVRSHNEDTALVTPLLAGLAPGELDDAVLEIEREGALIAVCDGMGGSAGGEVASRRAAEVLAAAIARRARAGEESLPAVVQKGLLEASAAVHGLASERVELRGMGTTATVCALRNQELAIAQVGDSRAYLFRDGSLTLLTRDQSLAMQLVESGQLAPDELESCGFRHIILQAVGSERVDVDLRAVRLRRGDVLLVCSDGLWDVLSGDAIASILARSVSVAAACEELVARALAEGGPDNVTCIVARARGDALDPPVRGEAPASRAVVLEPEPLAVRPTERAAAATAGTRSEPDVFRTSTGSLPPRNA